MNETVARPGMKCGVPVPFRLGLMLPINIQHQIIVSEMWFHCGQIWQRQKKKSGSLGELFQFLMLLFVFAFPYKFYFHTL